MGGMVCMFDFEVCDFVECCIGEVVDSVVCVYGGLVEMKYMWMYLVMMNYVCEVVFVVDVVCDIVGVDCVNDKFILMMGVEDFFFMLEVCLGVMVLVGMGDGNECYYLVYVFNDNIFGYGVLFWVCFVEMWMLVG